MNKYEGIFIIKPDLNEEGLKGILEAIESEIKKNKGKINGIKPWGKKTLAYSIKKFNEGVYYEVDFDAEPSGLKDMERKIHLDDDIIRYMIIKK